MPGAGQVQNGQSPVPQTDARFGAYPYPSVIRAAVDQGLRHGACDFRQVVRVPRLRLPKASYSTHKLGKLRRLDRTSIRANASGRVSLPVLSFKIRMIQ